MQHLLKTTAATGAMAVVLAMLLLTNIPSYLKILLQPVSGFETLCPLYPAMAPTSFVEDNSTVLQILHDPQFRQMAADRLAAAVKIDTLVADHMPKVADDPERWLHFGAFHEYLETTFPLVYATAEVHKVNTWGLVLHVQGRDPLLKPVMLAAHQDVVPVQHDTIEDWTYGPFLGHYDGERIYGRGASDCKNLLVAAIAAVEMLLERNLHPRRGVILAFGFDEEISGHQGARYIAQFLEEKFGTDSIYAIIDEGPGLLKDMMTGNMVAAPATGEKGYMDLEVELYMPGGHSSVPPDHGAIGIMGELAYRIEEDPYVPKLNKGNPLLNYLQCMAVHSDKLLSLQRKAILRVGSDDLATEKVMLVLCGKPLTRYLVQTSQAIDVIVGGEKANALPEKVRMVVNHRIAVGDSVAFIKELFALRVLALAQKYGMNMTAYGEKVLSPQRAKGSFFIKSLAPLESAPVTPSTGEVWQVLAATTRHVFEDVVFDGKLGYPLITAPAVMPPNTDTRYYWNLTENIFRYTPMTANPLENHIHSVDEQMPVDGHLQLTAWYYEYLQNI